MIPKGIKTWHFPEVWVQSVQSIHKRNGVIVVTLAPISGLNNLCLPHTD